MNGFRWFVGAQPYHGGAVVQHQELKSSNLKSAAYDAETSTLEVIFTNGNTYRYADVAPHHFTNLTSHGSPGSYFHAHIRQAHHATRVDD